MRMEKLISSRIIVQSVQQSYILPPDRRPGDWVVPICTNIPVIDLEGDLDCNHADIIQKILEASQEYGFFQVLFLIYWKF